MNYKLGLLEYRGLDNLGDRIQSLVTKELLPTGHSKLNQYSLHKFSPLKCKPFFNPVFGISNQPSQSALVSVFSKPTVSAITTL